MYGRRKLMRFGITRWRLVMWLGLGLVVLLLVVNIGMWVAYRGRVLPNVSLGAVSVGNIAYDQLDEKVKIDTLLTSDVTLTKDERSQVVHPSEIGIMLDWPATRERLKKQRSWFPVANLFAHRTVPIELTVDEQIFVAAQTNLAQTFLKEALPERIVFGGQNFDIAAPESGYRLDEGVFKDHMLAGLEAGQQSMAVPTTVIEPPGKEASLDGDLQTLRKKLAVKITFTLNGKAIQPNVADIGGWFVSSGRSMAFSADRAKAYIAGLGNSLYNAGNAASATSYALDKRVDTNFALSTTQATKYTYCAATKGVDQAHLPGFITKTAAVLGDPRGWNLGGSIAFERVESGCDFSLWLSAPSQMTSFGGVCDSYYSCRSGRNVVINFDRWQGATDPWNASGGSLEDYRVMVTNHEVGHWLGFGHRSCTGPGQPAPVMQQQSINLQGCMFNPWPTQSELAAL